ncbi:hypothetical protein QCI79_33970 [Bacillus cereus group sp. MG1]|uniref:hypothetical protein n=1 Tax=Bacillus cereus group sp. MG1 TaxID=3040243 RepID=UPI0033973A35
MKHKRSTDAIVALAKKKREETLQKVEKAIRQLIDYKEKCMNKFNEIRLLLCGHIHKVRALYFLFIFHFSLDFPKDGQKHPYLVISQCVK